MSILQSILDARELQTLEEEIAHYESVLSDYKIQLTEAPMDFVDSYDDEWALFDEAGRRLQIAKKALGLANRLSKPEERAHHKKTVLGILNRIRALVNRLTRQLTQKIEEE